MLRLIRQLWFLCLINRIIRVHIVVSSQEAQEKRLLLVLKYKLRVNIFKQVFIVITIKQGDEKVEKRPKTYIIAQDFSIPVPG